MTERVLLARDAKRNLGAELLASVREMRAGKAVMSIVFLSPQSRRRARSLVFRANALPSFRGARRWR